jgi:hypothetical protein
MLKSAATITMLVLKIVVMKNLVAVTILLTVKTTMLALPKDAALSEVVSMKKLTAVISMHVLMITVIP